VPDPLRPTSSPDNPGTRQANISSETLQAALELWGQSGEAHTIPINGRSMLPLLREGDRVLVAHSREVSIGDIVVFQRSDGLIAHRVLKINAGEEGERILHTKGDNVLVLDPPLKEVELVGVVAAIYRGSRQMDLDTPAWQAMNRWISMCMRALVSIYSGAGSATHPRPSPGGTKLNEIFSRLILRFVRITLSLYQGIVGGWKEGS